MFADGKTQLSTRQNTLETKACSKEAMTVVYFSWKVEALLFHSSVSHGENWRLPHVGIQTFQCDIQQDNFLAFSRVQPAGQDLETSSKVSRWGIRALPLGTFVRDRLVCVVDSGSRWELLSQGKVGDGVICFISTILSS